MIIPYVQKMTLLDFPGRVACTVFLYGCNLRCPFCHNPGLVTRPPEDGETLDGLIALLKKRKGVLDGVAITGGEPMLTDEIFDLLYAIRREGYAVKLDTNGFFPDRLSRALNERLVDYVAVDIKNSPARYAETVGLPKIDLAPLRRSIALLESSDVEHEFRTTVMREYHDRESLLGAAALIPNTKHYFLQCFRDSGDLLAGGCSAYSKEELEALRDSVSTVVPSVELRGV